MKHYRMKRKEVYMIKWALLEMNKIKLEEIRLLDFLISGMQEDSNNKVFKMIFLVRLRIYLEEANNNNLKGRIYTFKLRLVLWNL
jgi:hypothetical protein